MKKSRSAIASRLYSPHASLAALGLKLRSIKFFEVLTEHVLIKQKTIKHSPINKLIDAFIAILAGARGLVEINTRLRCDTALQRAFGRPECAEQSVVQETLDACTPENVEQLQQALNELFQQHSATSQHNYQQSLLLMDADLSGMPCGKKAERATPGYFHYEAAQGRQLGRVSAAQYGEVVVDQLYPGNRQLNTTLPELITAAEQTLNLDQSKRRRTVIRVDAGGGSINDVNWLLKRGYQFHGMDYSPKRAAKFAPYVREWVKDPRHPERQLGWVAVKGVGYVREVQRLMMKRQLKNGQVKYNMLLTTLSPEHVMQLLGRPVEPATDAPKVAVAYAELYDLRGGAIEIEIKESKQGLGITKRNKKRFAAQQMVMLLGTLAHNVVMWAKRWLKAEAPKLAGYGVPRMVRDVLQVSGFVEMEASGRIKRIVINKAAALGRQCVKALRVMLGAEHIPVSLGET